LEHSGHFGKECSFFGVIHNDFCLKENFALSSWGNLEDYCRELVSRGKELYVVAGPFGGQGEPLKGKVTVPKSTWKIIVVLDSPGSGLDGITASTRIIAVNVPNEQEINNDWRAYKVSVDELEKLTGYDFLSNVSPNIQEVIESKVDSP
jgi:endonuclease G, mitochondrial